MGNDCRALRGAERGTITGSQMERMEKLIIATARCLS